MIIELSWNNLVPELIQSEGAQRLNVGDELCFSLSETRCCTGLPGYSFQGRSKCPLSTDMPVGKKYQCDYCKGRDVTLVAKTGYGNSDKAIELLSADHVVYLALFSDNLIKVGVELWDRRQVRVTEQGALACMFIARGNGTVARNLERRIHNLLGFTEWVRLKTKLLKLGLIPDSREAEGKLRDAYESVLSHAGSTAIIEPEFIYLVDRYRLSKDVGVLDIEFIETVSGGAVISGTLEGVYGKILLLTNHGKLYALDASLLYGYSLTDSYINSGSGVPVGITTKSIPNNQQQSLF